MRLHFLFALTLLPSIASTNWIADKFRGLFGIGPPADFSKKSFERQQQLIFDSRAVQDFKKNRPSIPECPARLNKDDVRLFHAIGEYWVKGKPANSKALGNWRRSVSNSVSKLNNVQLVFNVADGKCGHLTVGKALDTSGGTWIWESPTYRKPIPQYQGKSIQPSELKWDAEQALNRSMTFLEYFREGGFEQLELGRKDNRPELEPAYIFRGVDVPRRGRSMESEVRVSAVDGNGPTQEWEGDNLRNWVRVLDRY